jgi:spermidine synthase
MSDILISELNGYRTLHFGNEWVQGRMRISRPAELALGYAEDMTAALLFSPPPKHIYVAGLGVGALPRWALANLGDSLKKLDIVELRDDVISLTAHSFPLPLDDKRVKLTEGDAAKALSERPDASFDWIWVDCYDGRGRVGSMESNDFYIQAHRTLKRNGVMIANMWSSVPRYAPGLRRLSKIFDGNVMLLPSVATENVIAMAVKTTKPLPDMESADMQAHARLLKQKYKLPFDRWTERMASVKTVI